METYFAKTLAGLEEALESELKSLGAEDVQVEVRGVSFKADQKTMYRIHLCSRLCIRVLQDLTNFFAKDPDDLYKKAIRYNWKKVIDVDGTFAIGAVSTGEHFPHSKYASLKLKDSIADHFRMKKGRRPDIDVKNPDVQLHLHIRDQQVTIAIDLTGESLHHRGYRPKNARAPLNEILAAGMLTLAGWNSEHDFLDPMCGSGTLLLEAMHMSANVPSQWKRDHFAFMNSMDFSEDLWMELRKETEAQFIRPKVKFQASDLDFAAVLQLKSSLKELPFEVDVEVKTGNFFELTPPEKPMFIIMNPPYGERIQTEGEIEELYIEIGNELKKNYSGSTAWMISSDLQALKRVGLKPAKRIPLKNGQLDCRFVGFNLFRGKRKDQLQNQED